MLPDEKKLLQRMAEDDQSAFRTLFDYYYPRVRVFLSTLLLRQDEAEDLAQNVFVKIWNFRAHLPEVHSLGAYLYRMTRNTALEYARKHRMHVELSEEYAETTAVDEEYFAREMRSRLESRIAEMPERRRQVITLSRLEGKSNDEIAAILGISKKTVENHLNAALRALRKLTSCLALFL